MIPIIYNIQNNLENLNSLKKSLNSIKKTNLDNGFLILIDNHNKLLDFSFDFSKFTVIQPEKELTKIELFKFSIMVGFNLFKLSDKIVVLNDLFEFNEKWFKFLNFMMVNELAENIGIVSVFNDDDPESVHKEPFFFESPINIKSFMMSRRLFNKLNSNNFFNDDENMNFDYSDFKSLKTSNSFMKLINKNNDRFLK